MEPQELALIASWNECRITQPLWKAVWQFLSKLNILLACNLAFTLFGIYTRELKMYVHINPAHERL